MAVDRANGSSAGRKKGLSRFIDLKPAVNASDKNIHFHTRLNMIFYPLDNLCLMDFTNWDQYLSLYLPLANGTLGGHRNFF